MARALVAWVGLGMLLGACHSDGVSVVPTNYDESTRMQTVLAPGGSVGLVAPPQGGFVAFVGVSVSGMTPLPQPASLTVHILDGNGALMGSDSLQITLVADGDGHLTPDLSSYYDVANVSLCPSASDEDHVDVDATVEVDVAVNGQYLSGRQSIHLACQQSDPTVAANCRCQCQGHFFLGKC